MRSAISVCLFFFALAAASSSAAQDPISVDPKHYRVEFENDQVRVLRVSYGAHEKSPMHEHPAGVAVAMTDAVVKFTLADGKIEERPLKAGQILWMLAEKHAPENVSDKPFEVVLTELKTK
jgi:quercetin dioxygenase-like cupin family protein